MPSALYPFIVAKPTCSLPDHAFNRTPLKERMSSGLVIKQLGEIQRDGRRSSKAKLDERTKAGGGGSFGAVDQSGPRHSESARQWLGPPEPQNKMDLLAEGITQLQAAMLKQYDKAKDTEKTHESIKPGTNVLPTLKDPSADTACVDIMDWLELIDAPMSDISDGSAAWWRGVVKEAHRAYGAWSLANPVEKLTIMPDITHLEDGQWARVNSRAATMLITALPEAVRQEAVARRLANSSTKLVYRLLQIYQPGGENEKVKILGHLQAPPTESDPQRAVEALRTWNRWLRRCRELNVQAPDPSLLCRGLNGLVRQVLEKNPDASFRTSLLKSNLRVDTNPSYESIESYYRHLMGECEALAVGMTSSATTTNPPVKAEPKLKPVRDPKVTQPSSTPPKAASSSTTSTTTVTEPGKYDKAKSEVPCKFFGKTARGCARTNRCPFSHSWEGLDKKDRCLACGGKGHLQKECPNKKYTPPSSQSGTPKGGSDKQQNPTSPTSPASTRTVRIDDKPEVTDVPSRGAAESDHGAEIREVLADVGRVLKSMTATSLKKLEVNVNPEMRAEDDYEIDEAQIKNVKTQEPDGLLDSGASHPMRQASHQEYANSAPVRVTLAGEDEKILRQNSKGTILVQEENSRVQPIVPLGAIIEDLGYTLHWTPTKLRLTHPEKGMIRVRVNNHCPEVAACDALAMIHELEMKQVNSLNHNLEALKARLDVMKLQDTRDWVELLREYGVIGSRGSLLKVLLKCPFTKDLPQDVHNLMLESFDVDQGETYLKALPISRRTRKALMNSKRWVVSLFNGVDYSGEDPLKLVAKEGKMLVEVDAKLSKLWDIHRHNAVYRVLLWAAATGRISDVIGAPPTDTWIDSSVEGREQDLRLKRSKNEPFGISGLPPLQQQYLDRETAAFAKQMLIWMLASVCNAGPVGFMMELPAPLQTLPDGKNLYPSPLELELWKAFRSVGGLRTVSFNMGAYGHHGKRPTIVGTNYPILYHLDGTVKGCEGCLPSSLLDKEEFRRWSQEFRAILLQAIGEGKDGSFVNEEELVNLGVKMSRLSKKQREEWKRHLQNDHQPYRADCSVCINAQAYGYQHRRRKMPGLYSVALDLAGPFKQKGRDMEFDDYKYVMVAAYRCPREYMGAASIPEEDRELYVPSDPEDGEDDPLEMDPMDAEEEKGTDGETEGEPLGPETLDEAVEEYQKGKEPAVIYITRPLRRRTAPHVLQAAKEILLQLRQSGLHVDVLHTDRAREFKAKGFKDWTVDANVRHTKTAGADPSGNSTAELGVKWGKAEKKQDAASTRWKRGWYGGPALDVKRGHVILRDDGGLTIAKSVKFDVTDPIALMKDLVPPAFAEGLPDKVLQDDRPPSRAELKAEIEFRSRKLYEDKSYQINDAVELYNLLEALGDVDRRLTGKTSVSSWYTGAFVHGGVAGVRNNTKFFPWTTTYLTGFARHYCGNVHFSALALAKNAQLGIHRDVHNTRTSTSYVVPLLAFGGGGLWVQEDEVEKDERVEKILPNGKKVSGKILEMQVGKPVEFRPRVWHEVQQWEGDRLVMLLYTPRGTKLKDQEVEELKNVGFDVHPDSLVNVDEEEEEEEVKIKTASVGAMEFLEVDSEQLVYEEVSEDEFFSPQLERDEEHDRVLSLGDSNVHVRRMLKKAEIQYTPDIENILSNLDEKGLPLEVTHNVSLSDVRKNIGKWKESALKEYRNLTEVKKAFTVRSRSELPPNCRIVPCKGVYTVKPDKGGYRRKTRFVACGNHVPEDGATDLFAAGVDATSMRTMLAFNAKRPWKTGTTDVRQAFVLARWRGAPVALEPPAIAYELGIAERGDMWFVEMAIYGLRESPALWSQFRDGELALARWTTEVDGHAVVMKLEQLVTDDQIWRIVREDGKDSEAYGFVLVYIDDLLIQAPDQIMRDLYRWVSDKWEVDALDVLDYDHPIRFLGMELHKTVEGVEIGQEGFVRELLRAHRHSGARSLSQGPKETLILTDEEEQALVNAEPIDLTGLEADVKEAQKRVGELMWLMSRTRPDIQYVVALMASKITRSPQMVNKIGQRLLDYLNETIGYRIKLNGYEDADGGMLNVFTDSSFAPSGGRQPLVTLSTAESELIEGIEGTLLAMSTSSCDATNGIQWELANASGTEGGPRDKTVHEGEVCGIKAMKEDIATEIPWDLYVAVFMVGAISPASTSADETVSTLRFRSRNATLAGKMTIVVEVGLASGRTVSLEAGLDDAVELLGLRAQTALAVGRGRLVDSCGCVLDQASTVKAANVKNGDLLMLQISQVRVCAGVHAFAAILGDGSVVSWGDRRYGGDSRRVQDQLKNVQHIKSSDSAFAAILADGCVVSWGEARSGGDSSAVHDQLKDVQQIQASRAAFAAIRRDGSVVTWGNPLCGGDSETVRDRLHHVLQIQSACDAFAAILRDGSVVTWGDPDSGGDSSSVQDVLKNVQQIQATEHAFAAILHEGSVVTWGSAGSGGDSSSVQGLLRNVQHVQATGAAFAALLHSGAVVTWGHAHSGGDSSSIQDQLRHVQQIQSTGDAFAAILHDGSVVTWGDPQSGGHCVAVQEQLKNVWQIQSSSDAFAAVLRDGSVVTWGDARNGGDSLALQEQLTRVQHIQASCDAFAATLDDGSVLSWGNARFGADSRPVHDQLKNVQHIQSSDSAFAAVLADGSVVTWGDARCGGDSSAVKEQLKVKFASSVKRIKTVALQNVNKKEEIVTSLQAEVARLAEMLQNVGEQGGAGDAVMVSELHDDLAERERLLSEMTKSRAQQIAEAKQLQGQPSSREEMLARRQGEMRDERRKARERKRQR
ncbi:Copia protein [Symbiodinium microadriaticum]|uniref:Copia protein n=1 Tax=Symbiodinium microadriaticum TaxID=2951 RepID=A0A1Q9DQN4_SYMMI|nr:Copia protein [Symbiodinium microadriaticum]